MARFRDDLADLLPKAAALKRRLSDRGYMLTGEEPLKVTVCPKSFGYTGTEIAATLEENGAFPEFYDPDHVVLMLSPWNSDDDLVRLEQTLCSIPQRTPIILTPPPVPHPVRVMTPRQALFAVSERLLWRTAAAGSPQRRPSAVRRPSRWWCAANGLTNR